MQPEVCQGLPAPDALRDLLRKRRHPVVFRHAVSDGARDAFHPHALKDRFGDRHVEILREEVLTGRTTGPIHERYETCRLKAYMDELQQGTDGYLSQYPMHPTFADAMQGELFPSFYLDLPHRRANLWVGPGGTNSKLHFDRDENLFWQLYGRKRFRFVAPKYGRRLYPVNISWGDGYSPIDLQSPDTERYPRFVGVPVHDVILDPGDAVYVPCGWWHDVTSLDTSVSLSLLWWPLPLWWEMRIRRFVQAATERVRGGNDVTYGPTSPNW